MFFLRIFFVNVLYFFIHGDTGSINQNVFETNKHLNTMQTPWVVHIRLHMLVVCLLRTTPSFIKDHQIFVVGKPSNWTTKWDLLLNLTTFWRKRTTIYWSLLMSGVKSVSIHEEALASCGSFAPQGHLIAQQNLAIRVSRITCLAINTNLPSGWFYQDHRWSLINESVVLIKRICGPT